MAEPPPQQITQMLLAWSDGDPAALEKLTPLVYDELHRLARQYMQNEPAGHTLQSSALVNEAYLRLIDWKNVRWQNRAHFFGVAAKLMRRILVDFARTRHAARRGGNALQVSLDKAAEISKERSEEFIALDEVLETLAELDPRKCQIIELRFFGGLGVKETAEALKISTRTVLREWSLARAWLYRELGQREKK